MEPVLGTLYFSFSFNLGPLAAALVNRWGMLAVATTGSLLVCSSILLSSLIYNFIGFTIVYGFICGETCTV